MSIEYFLKIESRIKSEEAIQITSHLCERWNKTSRNKNFKAKDSVGEGKSRLEKAEEEIQELEDEFGKITHSTAPENYTWEMWTR